MDSLEFLVSKGLLTSEGRPPPLRGPLHVVQNGVIFQEYCHNGLRYDIAVSWLQKAIRRGLLMEALYCCYHIFQIGKIFRSHLLNRLITILSEDIGPAEAGLAPDIYESYVTAMEHNNKGETEDMKPYIIDMTYKLNKAKKSRITDLLIHAHGDREIDEEFCDMDEVQMVQWGLRACRSRVKCPVHFRYGDGKVLSRDLAVYQLWEYLIQHAEPETYEDTVALLELFQIRGVQYGELFLMHAITLYTRTDELSSMWSPPTPSEALPEWDRLSELDFPVRNSAVDIHTLYGRKYLGRGHRDFWLHGSKLCNWTPFECEEELIESELEEHKPVVDQSVPRPYQEEMIEKSVVHLASESSGWLVMACGTGKTKTSYWIKDQVLEGQEAYLVVVVTPWLEILKQFFKCWSALNRHNRHQCLTGILASCHDTFSKDDYSNYEYIEDLQTFMRYPDRKKYIFTTYSSIHKLVRAGLQPDMVIYDEAHHIKPNKVFGYFQLYLTATPEVPFWRYGSIIERYTIQNAIADGCLTDYRISVLDTDDIAGVLHYIASQNKKTIVFSRTNKIAKELYDMWKEQGSSSTDGLYVNCKTSMSDRKHIFRHYVKAPKAMIFNCAIMGEGLDFTECDSVFLESGYTSPKRVIQAVGRALRLHEGKQIANIYMLADGKETKRINCLLGYDPDVGSKIEYV